MTRMLSNANVDDIPVSDEDLAILLEDASGGKVMRGSKNEQMLNMNKNNNGGNGHGHARVKSTSSFDMGSTTPGGTDGGSLTGMT